MSLSEKEIAFLVYLYEGHFTHTFDIVDFREWGAENHLSPDESDSLFYRLDRLNLVEAGALGPHAQITPLGLMAVENQALGALALVEKQNQTRHKLLLELNRIMREEGPQYYGEFDALVRDLDLEREGAGLNLDLLVTLGYLEQEGFFLYRISELGEEAVEAYNRQLNLATRLLQLKEAEDKSKRGHDLEDLLIELAQGQGFVVNGRARSLGEENDAILTKDSEHWLVSCKWEIAPAKSAYVDEVRIRVAKRPGTIGVLVSMSGFSKEAVAEAGSNTSLGLVLLMSKADVEVLMRGEESLLELLRERRRHLVTYRQAIFRPEEL